MAKTAWRSIAEYLGSTRKKRREVGYSSYLQKVAGRHAGELEEGIAKAESEYARIAAGRGAAAEKLSKIGGGYGGYLSDTAQEKKNKGITESIQGFIEKESDAHVAFNEKKEREEKAKHLAAIKEIKEKEAELQEIEKKKSDAYKAAKRGLEAAGMINYDDAYSYAVDMGVSDADARLLAQTTTRVARSAAIERVVKAIFNRKLTKMQATYYADGLGLSKEDVAELGDIAFRVNESIKDKATAEDYLDYLKNKE